MPYNPKIKADTEIFFKIRFIEAGQSYILKPILPELFEQEASCYMFNSIDVEFRKYFPQYIADSVKDAKYKLNLFVNGMLTQQSLFYCIRAKDFQAPLGYIHLLTPAVTTGLNEWAVEFWMGRMTNKGIMTIALQSILLYLKKYQVTLVCALVDKDNVKAIRVLEKVGFAVGSEEAGGKRNLYGVRLQ